MTSIEDLKQRLIATTTAPQAATNQPEPTAHLTETGSVSATLVERGHRYGDFETHAQITQDLKAVMTHTPNWTKLAPDQRECLEMIAHKIGRILNGDPNYADSWHDIAGYAALVDSRLTTAK